MKSSSWHFLFPAKENVDTHLTYGRTDAPKCSKWWGPLMNKFQKWEAENDQTVAAESENESVGDSPARGGLNKALELTVNSARGEKISQRWSGHWHWQWILCGHSPNQREWFEGRPLLTLLAADLEQERPVGPTVNEKAGWDKPKQIPSENARI